MVIGYNGNNYKIENIYVGVNNVAQSMKNGWVGVDNLAKPINSAPSFQLPTFTGSHTIFGDETQGRIELYESGTLTMFLPQATYDLVGGGGGGSACALDNTKNGAYVTLYASTGGGGGYVTHAGVIQTPNYSEDPDWAGASIDVVVGAGGSGGSRSSFHWGGSGFGVWQRGSNGGQSSILGHTANGGQGGGTKSSSYYSCAGSDGGSGSGAAGYIRADGEDVDYQYTSGTPSGNGENGGNASNSSIPVGVGQGAGTTAINGVNYAGAGGCGYLRYYDGYGEENYGYLRWNHDIFSTSATSGGGNGGTELVKGDGVANTGGGGGGGCTFYDDQRHGTQSGTNDDDNLYSYAKQPGGTGGSGIVIVSWGY